MNNTKTYRILGTKGRITIPYNIRNTCDLKCGDIVSFAETDGKITLKREKICDGCQQMTLFPQPKPNQNLLGLLDNLTPKEEQAALLHLSYKVLERLKSNA